MNEKSKTQIKIELLIEALKVTNQPVDTKERESLRKELVSELKYF